MIKAVVFDWGGVLIDLSVDWYLDYCASYFGVTKNDFNKEFIKYNDDFQKGKISESELWKKISNSLGVKSPGSKSLWEEAIRASFKDRKEMYELIEKLRSNGYKVGFLSNTEAPTMEYFIENGYQDYFDATVFSCAEKTHKPEKEIYDIVLDRLGVRAEESVFIDDLEINIEGARKAGMKGIVFEDYENLIKELESFGVKV